MPRGSCRCNGATLETEANDEPPPTSPEPSEKASAKSAYVDAGAPPPPTPIEATAWTRAEVDEHSVDGALDEADEPTSAWAPRCGPTPARAS
mmetsp:Transcript_108782/g.314107  ORF Transcript_108782/g.314107 Transcript_108782/m.314107 type:complete len:92 (-) Transcript_108782:302-577(-)